MLEWVIGSSLRMIFGALAQEMWNPYQFHRGAFAAVFTIRFGRVALTGTAAWLLCPLARK